MYNTTICFDPAHYGYYNGYGTKPDGETYWESKAMLDLGLKLADALPNTILTRYDDNDISLTKRGEIAAENNCDYFISLHTNSNPETTDKSIPGIEIYYSVDIPSDKEIGLRLMSIIQKHTGIASEKVIINESTNYPGEDYYTVIDSAQDNGVPHVFLVEIGSHWQFGSDYDNNINGCILAFKEFFNYEDGDNDMDTMYVVDVESNDTLNLRYSPTTSSEIITQIPPGSIVTSDTTTSGNWVYVTWHEYTGWVYGTYIVEITEPCPCEDSRVEEIVVEIIDLVKELLTLV